MPIPESPLTRREMFLAAAATGDASNLPDPKTREEMYLEAIAQGSGGGSSGGGVVEIPLDTSGGTTTLTKTGQEIMDYISAGKLPYVVWDPTGGAVANDFILGVLEGIETELKNGQIDSYNFYFYGVTAYCTSLDQYPAFGE